MKTKIESTSVGARFIPLDPPGIRKLGLRFGGCLQLQSADTIRQALFLGWLNPRGLGRSYGLDVLTKMGARRPALFASYLQMDDRGREFSLGLEPVEGEAAASEGPVSLSLGNAFLDVPPAAPAKKQKDGTLAARVFAACDRSITLMAGWPDLKKIGLQFTTETAKIRIGGQERRVHLKTLANKSKIESARQATRPSAQPPPLLAEAILHFDDRDKQLLLLLPLVGDRVGLSARAGEPAILAPDSLDNPGGPA